jgi:hypothetical protein
MKVFSAGRLGLWWLVLAGVGTYWALVFGVSAASGRPVHEWLVHLGVPALEGEFGDMALVAVWCDWAADGKDPYREPPVDGEGRVLRMNYPPVFLSLGWLGLSSGSFRSHALLWGAAFYLALAAFAQPASLREALAWIGIACSPAVVFAVERANFDLAVFVLLAAAALLHGRPWASALCMVAAAFLKFYPFAGLGAVAASGRRGWFAFAAAAAVFAVYLFTIRGWLPFVFGSLDGNVSCAFGAGVVPAEIGRPDLQPAFQLGFLALGLAAGLCGLFFGVSGAVVAGGPLFSARLGLPVFLLLFLSGAQFDYKMAFLVFAVPACLGFSRGAGVVRLAGRLWLACFFAYIYWMFYSGESCLRNFLLKQAVASVLFLASAFLCGFVFRGAFPFFRRKGNFGHKEKFELAS